MDCVFHKTTTMLCWQDSVLNPAVDWTRPRTVYVKKGGRDLQSGTLGEGRGGWRGRKSVSRGGEARESVR